MIDEEHDGRDSRHDEVHVTVRLDTVPFDVGGENMQLTVSTSVPSGCSTLMTALVNARSVIASVQFGFGQSGAPAIGVTGGSVTTWKVTLPFSTSLAGIASLP